MKAFDNFDIYVRQSLLILFLAGLLFWSSMSSLMPTLPLYIANVGASKQQIGIVMGSFAIGLLLFRPMLGNLADRGGRKIPLIIGVIVAAIAPFGYLFFPSIPILGFVRAVHGVAVAAFTTGYSALVADLAPPAKRGEIVSYMTLATPIGLAIGPALGGYLQATAGNGTLFLLASELAFVALLGIGFIINPPITKYPSTENQKTNFWQLIVSPRVRIPALVMLLVGLSLGTVHTFIALFIQETGVNFNAGLFFTIAALASFSVRIFSGRGSDRFGRGLFITAGVIGYFLATLLLWQANSQITFILAAIAEGAGGGTIISMVVTLMTDRSLPQERGRIFAICVAGLDLGIAIAAPILGYVAEQVGYRQMFAYCTALSFLALLIFLTQSNKNLRDSLSFALGRGKDHYYLNKS
ncbi:MULTISPECIES: MFS transporter [Calothrix]|uniref:MFS transporter n=2 Tax=Calothrix TaxID=1186 RepID=A0ABR8A459_9CYAN|nr:MULTISPECIES: MFS transporter [Calothrix]MBD2194604.1 MFS transporter [Calothrix parietina FACHB-288]MBD2223290.1 MFS transporter [Calothrix anomala FACHB-343]